MTMIKNITACLFFFFIATLAHDHGDKEGKVSMVNSRNSNETHLRGEGNFFILTIFYHQGPGTLTVRNSQLKWGKWVKGPGRTNLHDEVGSPDGLAMTAWGEYHIQATGRESAPSGTEGSFDIYYSDGTRVAYIYFDTVWMGMSTFKTELYDTRFKKTYMRWGEDNLEITYTIQWAQGAAVAEA